MKIIPFVSALFLSLFSCGAPPEPKPAVCQDGTVDAGEGCDDGNDFTGDGCDNNCRVEQCGDGIVAGFESCDDGNVESDDGCSSSCDLEFCGDELLNNGGEECDNGTQCDDGTFCFDVNGCEGIGDGLCKARAGDGCAEDCTIEECDGTANCGGCQTCAQGLLCADQLEDCQNNFDCLALSDCLSTCAPGNQLCVDNCAQQFPNGIADLRSLSGCVICGVCFDDCDGAAAGCP
jgi:cysteine-rich repeat protein